MAFKRSVCAPVLSYGIWLMVASTTSIAVPALAQRVVTAVDDRNDSRSPRITVDADSTPLSYVLHLIANRAGLTMAYDEALLPERAKVTLHVRDIAVSEAFARALRGTRLAARFRVGGKVFLVPDAVAAEGGGTITGTVVDATTRKPLTGVLVTVDGATRGVRTNEEGAYRLENVGSGAHVIRTKYLGYARNVKRVAVGENAQMTVDFVLDASVNALDQVVVTGTVAATQLKAVPNAMTVITAKQIEDRGITTIDQLFRGDVPGVFARRQGTQNQFGEVTMFSRGTTGFTDYGYANNLGGQSWSDGVQIGTNPIKTYVDGVELADPKYLSQIDTRSIERIEILTGPQASTLYGSNAINGVMQIFTKRGSTSRPQLLLNTLSGLVANNFSPALTPQHDYSAQLSGVRSGVSYNVGGSWEYMGAWSPSRQMSKVNIFGGARLDIATDVGKVNVDASARQTNNRNRTRGDDQPAQTEYESAGWYEHIYNRGISTPTIGNLGGQTLGLVLGYAPKNWWSHEIGLGTDASDYSTRWLGPPRYSIWFDSLTWGEGVTHLAKRSLRYNTTIRAPLGQFARATMTMGGDRWNSLATDWSRGTFDREGRANIAGTESKRRNAGAFFQGQLGVVDQLFITYGLRAEWNPGFGADYQPSYAPRYGIAYSRELGPLTAKLRASYGRSTRPPAEGLRDAIDATQQFGQNSEIVTYYGNFIYREGNPDLGPEHQKGGEGGIDLYWGTRASLVVTRYNQTVDGLIDILPAVDSTRSLVANIPRYDSWPLPADGYQYFKHVEYVNLASIRNSGWELQGSVNVGPFTGRGTYSWTKSRSMGVNSQYRSMLDITNKQWYEPGATFNYLPEHTWATGVTYTNSRTTLSLDLNGVSGVTFGKGADMDEFSQRYLSSTIRLWENRLRRNSFRYVSHNQPYALADLNASHRITRQCEATLQVLNLANNYTNDQNARFAVLGRQIKGGFRLRF